MTNDRIERCDVMDFLASAEVATLEVKRLHRRLKTLEERRERLHTRRGAAAKKITQLIGDEQKRELALVSEELEQYRRVEAFVERVPDQTCRTILRRRYLDMGKNWDDIRSELAEDGMFYSQRHLLRLHTKALEEARRLWDEEGKEETGKTRR